MAKCIRCGRPKEDDVHTEYMDPLQNVMVTDCLYREASGTEEKAIGLAQRIVAAVGELNLESPECPSSRDRDSILNAVRSDKSNFSLVEKYRRAREGFVARLLIEELKDCLIDETPTSTWVVVRHPAKKKRGEPPMSVVGTVEIRGAFNPIEALTKIAGQARIDRKELQLLRAGEFKYSKGEWQWGL